MKLKYLIIPLLLFSSCSNNITSSNISSISSSTTTSESINTIPNDKITTSSSIISSSQNSTIQPTNKKKIKIYLNPSVQKNNIYYDKVTTEAQMMNKVSNEIYQALSKDTRFEVYHNNRYLPLSESVKESNTLGVDYHLALHSNAGGGSGSECYYTDNSYFANHILNSFNRYHTFKNRGLKNGSHLYELKNSTAQNKALIEFLFHDNKTEADFIIKNYVVLALSVIEAMYELTKI